MRKQSTHAAGIVSNTLDRPQLRYNLHSRQTRDPQICVTAVHDTVKQVEVILYQPYVGGRHDHSWTPIDAMHLVDWLNERALGYPKSERIPYLRKLKGMSRV